MQGTSACWTGLCTMGWCDLNGSRWAAQCTHTHTHTPTPTVHVLCVLPSPSLPSVSASCDGLLPRLAPLAGWIRQSRTYSGERVSYAERESQLACTRWSLLCSLHVPAVSAPALMLV